MSGALLPSQGTFQAPFEILGEPVQSSHSGDVARGLLLGSGNALVVCSWATHREESAFLRNGFMTCPSPVVGMALEEMSGPCLGVLVALGPQRQRLEDRFDLPAGAALLECPGGYEVGFWGGGEQDDVTRDSRVCGFVRSAGRLRDHGLLLY